MSCGWAPSEAFGLFLFSYKQDRTRSSINLKNKKRAGRREGSGRRSARLHCAPTPSSVSLPPLGQRSPPPRRVLQCAGLSCELRVSLFGTAACRAAGRWGCGWQGCPSPTTRRRGPYPSCPKSSVNFFTFRRSSAFTVGRVVARERSMSDCNTGRGGVLRGGGSVLRPCPCPHRAPGCRRGGPGASCCSA